MTVTHALHDGRAGNARQALALAHALDADAVEVALDPHVPWRWLAPRRLPLSAHAFGDAFTKLADRPPELAIGCGRQAALATRVLRARGSKVVQILDPRIDPRHWDVVVAPEHDGLHGDNVVTMLGSLHPIDDIWLAQARQEFPGLGTLPSPRIAVLVGGPSPHWAMTDEGFAEALADINSDVRAAGGSLLVSASRRTPARWREHMQSCGAALAWTSEDDGQNPYRGLLGWAEAISCTADSVNMLSEACATNAPVHVMGADLLQGRPRRFLDALLRLERVHLSGNLHGAPPVLPLREPLRVAALVRERLAATSNRQL